MNRKFSQNELRQIPGVGQSIAKDLNEIGIFKITDLVGTNPEELYQRSNNHAGCVQDRCLLYVFRCAVYFAETPDNLRDAEKFKWWYWKNNSES